MDRSLRRHQRERVIAARVRQWRESWHFDAAEPGERVKWAAHRSLLGCFRPRCGLCHPEKRWHRKERRQAEKREIEREAAL